MQVNYRGVYIDVKKGTKVADLLKNEIKNSETNVIACKFNNEVKNLNYEITKNGNLELVDLNSKDGMRIYKRGLIYIIAKAFKEIYNDVLITINYQLFHAMYCTIDNIEITEDVIKKVKEKVDEIISKDLPIERRVMTRQEALKFYEKEKTLKGKLQLDLKTKKEVTLYYCEDYYNYFYGVLPNSTGFVTTYEIKKYNKGFIVRYPNEEHPEELVEFIDMPKLFNTLQEYEDVHKILNINTLYKLNTIIKQGNIVEQIVIDEMLHEKKIAAIADEVAKNKKIKLITIAGPSSSGKTTFAKRLEIQLKINGIKPKIISVDDYFVEREDTPRDKHGEYNFESINAIDKTLLNSNLMKLLNGEEIDAPTFDFHAGTKTYTGKKMKLEKDEVLVMEGIHCLNDELTYLIPKENKFKIYISALTVLNIDYYNRISTTDTRLIRRIVRDNQFRGYSAEHTLKMWPSVNQGEIENIFKFQEEADAMFNSSLIYELSVLKNFAIPLLKEIKPNSELYSEAKRLYSMLSYFEPIDSMYVPQNSLLREFIGGSIFE